MRRTLQALLLATLPALGLVACAEQAEQEGMSGETAAEAAGAREMSMEMDPMELRSAIESAAADFEAAAAAGDAAAIAALYTQDATLLPDGAEIIRGRGGIQDYWAALLSELPEDATVDLETVDVDGAGDLAYEIGTFTVTAGGETIDAGKFVVVWRHEPDGSWKMLADIFNRNEPMGM